MIRLLFYVKKKARGQDELKLEKGFNKQKRSEFLL